MKINKKVLAIHVVSLLLLTVIALPLLASAQIQSGPTTVTGAPQIGTLSSLITKIENLIALVFSAIAVIMFVVAGILFLTAGGNAEKVQEARSAAIWGVAGVVIGLVAFSIVAIISTFLSNGSY